MPLGTAVINSANAMESIFALSRSKMPWTKQKILLRISAVRTLLIKRFHGSGRINMRPNQIAGINKQADTQIIRSDASDANGFSVWHFKQGKLEAMDAINRPTEFNIGKKLIKSKREIPLVDSRSSRGS